MGFRADLNVVQGKFSYPFQESNYHSSVCYPDAKYKTELNTVLFFNLYLLVMYSNLQWAGWYGVRFSAPVQTGPGAHQASCTMDSGSL